MRIRTLHLDERPALLDLLDGWELDDGWRGRDFFRRHLELDPTFEERNVWVVEEAGQLISCLQIFPRSIRVGGTQVPLGGIGSVFTSRGRRRSGLSSALLKAAVQAMQERGMEMSLLSAVLVDWYRRLGWESWGGGRALVRRTEARAPAPIAMTVEAFDPGRDLDEIVSLATRYSRSLDGTVCRDRAQWMASLTLSGNPTEDFWVVRLEQGPYRNAVAAYLRATLLGGRLLVTEWGYEDGAGDAVALLFDHLLEPRDPDPLAQGRLASEDLRREAVLPPVRDPDLERALARWGLMLTPIVDHVPPRAPQPMLRCLDPKALARRLATTLEPGENAEAFLRRVLPPERFSFWPADRF